MRAGASLVIGIDIGTSGARAVAMDAEFAIHGQASAALRDFGPDGHDPLVWFAAVAAALVEVLDGVTVERIVALCVDGTSGTMLPVDVDGRPLAPALMYNDAVEDRDILGRIAETAPVASAAHGPTSGLAKALHFQRTLKPTRVLHQADWIAGQFSGRFDVSDENNALKTGYDPVSRQWPDWMAGAGAPLAILPIVVAAGSPVGAITPGASSRFGLSRNTIVVAGTTDGCASFLATGADGIGDGVTALGSSLTVKLLCDRPIFAPKYGVYSHRLGNIWLAGGASNTGGKVLAHYFSPERIAALSENFDEAETGLDYYPLLGKGERFPIYDPDMSPRLEPRPDDDGIFLKGMLEGIATIEAIGYRCLSDLGGPSLRSLRTVGGGAKNAPWSAIRRKKLGVDFLPAHSGEAAAGAARLALQGARQAGLL